MQVKSLQLKRALRTALLVLLLNAVGMGKIYAQSFTVDNLRYAVNSDGVSVTVNGLAQGVSASGSLVIPEIVTFNGTSYSVTTIGDYAFMDCSGFTGSLTIGNSVTTIGDYAFFWCGFTGNLTIPNSVTTIGEEAFAECSGFTGSLTIGNSVTTIGYRAFEGCSGFTGSLIIGNSVTTIGSEAFSGCINLTGDLAIPNSVITIGDRAFSSCSGFAGTVAIGNSVTSIGADAFYHCSGLSGNLAIPSSVMTIGGGAFSGCSGLTSDLTIPNSVTSIGRYAFSGCSGFTGSLTIGNSVTTIGDGAFYGCGGFFSITSLAETPPTLGDGSFQGNKPVYVPCGFEESYSSVFWGGFSNFIGLCGGTVTVVANPSIGGTVTGGGLFEDGQTCTIIATTNEGYIFTQWTQNGTIVSTNSEYTFYVAGDMTLVAHFVSDDNIIFADAIVKSICVNHWDTNGDGELSYEEAASVIGLANYFQSNSQITSFDELQYFIRLSSIGDYCFIGCSGLTSIVLPDFVTSIGNQAFNGCNSLTGNLNIPNSVTTIGNSAFFNCISLTGSLTIPNSVITIGNSAFYGCSGFNGSLTISNSVTTIGNSAFFGCSGFTGDLDIPYALTTIGSKTFQGCSGFTGDLTIPESVTSIGDYAFSMCSGFTGSLTIPDSVITIGNNAFHQCRGLTGSLTIPNSVTAIGDAAFSGCSGFTGNLIIPNSVTEIGGSTFSGCSGFTGELVIPNSVTTIGAHAFDNCSGFTGSLTIPNSVTTIKSSAFSGCINLTGNLTIPNSVTSIGEAAFYNCSGFTGELVIPNSVISIGVSAFSGCSGFSGNLTFGNSVTSIDSYAFYNCYGFTGNLTIPNSINSIGNNAFFNCSGFDQIIVDSGNNVYDSRESCNAIIITSSNELILGCKNTTIPNSVTTIGDYALYGCSGFTDELTIPSSVTTIGNFAFYSCNGFIGSLTIPNSVTTIGNSAFRSCSGLTEAIVFNATPPSLGWNVFDNSTFPIYVPYESLNDYETTLYWSNYENRILPMAYTTISGYGEGEGNYRFIASPLVENTDPSTVDNMITETEYDLYRFDQSEDLEWRNYEYSENTQGFMLVNGQGYLYANEGDVNLIFKGNFNEDETKDVALAYTEDNPTTAMRGWNLVGNPFPVNAYADRSYYVMNEDGTALEPITVSSTTAIAPCKGVMVKAEATGESVTFSKTAPEAANNQGVLQIAVAQVNQRGTSTGSGNLALDKAIVSFNAGDALEKFVFNTDNAQLYIPQGGKEFAIAYAEKQGEMPLNFKATKNGEYTLAVNLENVEIEYLHLIDNLTGANIDLLATPSYTFEAKTTDYASRFRLVFSGCEDADGDNDAPFVFVSNGEIVIVGDVGDAGTASLQVVDVFGHICRDAMIASPNHRVPTAGMTPGVYVLRLINGDSVRMQKIVIE